MKVHIVIIFSFIFLAIFAETIADFIPHKKGEVFSPPSSSHLLGTNDVGDDVLKELIIAMRVSVFVSIFSAILSSTLGLFIGIFSGYFRGLISRFFESVTEIFLVIPTLPLTIVFSFHLTPSIFNIVLLISIFSWPPMARVVRAKVLQLKNSVFVQSAILFGASSLWIITRHIVPNLLEIFLARFSMLIAYSLILESSLSFLGLSNPDAKSWGAMLHFALKRGALINDAFWCFIPPGLCIAFFASIFVLLSLEIEKRYLERFQSEN